MRKNRDKIPDRFIPNRAKLNAEVSNYLLKSEGCSHKRANWCPLLEAAERFYDRRRYKELLWRALFPKEQQGKVLHFTGVNMNISNKRDEEKIKPPSKMEMWPVKPRKTPLIRLPSLVLDMPDVSHIMFQNHYIDWSSTGCIATINGNEIVLCYTGTSKMKIIKCLGAHQSLKWNMDGTLLATVRSMNQITIWGGAELKMIHVRRCFCVFGICTIKSLQWSKSNMLVTGCSTGRLTVWTHDLKCVKTHHIDVPMVIFEIKFSAYEKYVSVKGYQELVTVCKWPELTPLTHLPNHWAVRCIDWHPEKDKLCAIAVDRSRLILYNVVSAREVASVPLNSNFNIDAIAFNPISAELVVSYYYIDEEVGILDSKILILADFNTVVDVIDYHAGRVIQFMWSFEGYQLGTIGADENLVIWDFFGTCPTVKKKKTKKKVTWGEADDSTILNMSSFGSSIR